MAKHPFLGLVALGPVDPDILRSLRSALSKFLLLPVRVLRPKSLPMQTYHVTRHQYNAIQLLEYLLDDVETEAIRVLGVTAKDLCIPILTFVFGHAQLKGKAAVISLFRPRGDDVGILPPRQVFLGRLIKLSLHELGHTFGLEHCNEAGCLMGFSTNLTVLDQKKTVFCDYCQILLTDCFREQGLLPPFRRHAEKLVLKAANPTTGNSRKVVHKRPAGRPSDSRGGNK
jgi:archaemetzincin